MANTSLIKRSSVANKVPTTSDLSLGELAVNTYDGKLFLKKSVGGTESIVDLTDADKLDGQHGSYYTGYTDTAIANLIDSAPNALNTLNELSAALNDDASFSTTVTNSIATKLPLAGGTLTGNLLIQRASGTSSLSITSTNDYATLEMGGSIGAFIDLKSPASDDYDIRFVHSGHIYAKTNITLAPTSGNVVNITRDTNITGTCTATTFSGSGASLTNIPAAQLTGVLPALDGSNLTGLTVNNAQTLDNLDSTQFVRSDADDTLNGQYIINDSADEKLVLQGSTNPILRFKEGTTNKAWLQWHGTNGYVVLGNSEDNTGIRLDDQLRVTRDGFTTNHQVWDAGNDGSGSGLDADTLDGQQASAFLGVNATAAEASALDIVDTRNDGARVPNDYASQRVTSEFTNQIINGWWSTLTVKGWADGYAPWQLVGKSDTGQSSDLYARFGHGQNNTWSSLYKIWHAGSDGSGSTLDADTLDGVQGSNYLRKDVGDTATNRITFTNGALQLSSHYYQGYYSGTANYIHLYPYGTTSGNASVTNIRAWNGSTADVFQITGGTATGVKWRGYTVWTAENDGSGSTLDADLWDGNQFASYLNQAVLTSSTVNFARVNVTGSHGINNDGWFRNTTSGEGLYNNATTQHFYSDDDDYWNIAGGTTANGLRFRDEHGGTIRGYVYATNSNHVGFLNQSGSWTLRTQTEGITKLGSNGYQLVNGNVAQNLKYIAGTNSSDMGISGYNSDGTWKFQLYGTTNYYGFLNSNWGSWDIQKNIDGHLKIRYGGSLRTVWNEANDGSGSSLDSDKLDGEEGSYYLDYNNFSNTPTIPSAVTNNNQLTNGAGYITSADGGNAATVDNLNASQFIRSDTDDVLTKGSMTTISASLADWMIRFVNNNGTNAYVYMSHGTHGMHIRNDSSTTATYLLDVYANNGNRFRVRGADALVTSNGNTMWHAGNDGSGSGLSADNVDGLDVHTGRNNEANKIVRTDGNGFLQAGYINTSSANDTGNGLDCKFYASEDDYIRYIDLRSMRAIVNSSARSTAFQGREQFNSNQDYWIGSAGWGADNFDSTVWDYGSCFFDVWSNPSGQPSGTSHWTGVQAMHYTNGGARYGMRITCGAGQPQLAYIQGRWNYTTNGWAKLWNALNDGSGSGLDADKLRGWEGFPAGTAMLFQQSSAPTGWTKSSSHNNKALRVVTGNVGSGGSNSFSTAFNSSRGTSGGSVSNHTLSTAQMPSHTHTGKAPGHDTNSASSQGYPANNNHNQHRTTDRIGGYNMAAASHANTGSSNSHNHGFTNPSINLNVTYVDVIIATKD